MASIVNEIESIAGFIEPLFTGSSFHYQSVPVEPSPNSLVVRYLMGANESETNYHYRLDRHYQIVYFGDSELACLQKFEQLEREINNTFVIPLKESDRYLRLDSFSFSQPFSTESGTSTAIIGVLQSHIRESREQPFVEKINNVYPDINKGGR